MKRVHTSEQLLEFAKQRPRDNSTIERVSSAKDLDEPLPF